MATEYFKCYTIVDVILKFHLILIGLLDTCTHLNLLYSGPQEKISKPWSITEN